eukprot:CAMPEP_0176011400 /NCGR_PEP_ID=MMETSP0120_2-20121206/5265_1 /TAXON_ID=160619 /ORGANISM="Kryptoperidinium foliaceum, Strain CCMP 1326" /LENGTH=164 /DNA_ID=CAMNT_0017344263 /DNA_START=62 /DNA_END=553 /DNA_ORIENTATION=+
MVSATPGDNRLASEDSVQSLPWCRPPPRSGKDIFAAAARAGTFHTTGGQGPPAKATRPADTTGLSRLVAGDPVIPRGTVQVPRARREAELPVRMTSPPFELALAFRNKYPRQGTPFSLAYHNPRERRAAHDGFGPMVSRFASPLAVELEPPPISPRSIASPPNG